MPRTNSGLELFRKLDTLQVFRQAGSTQTTAAAAVTQGATTVNFTATTGFTANDAIAIVGAGGAELNAIGAAITPTTAVPILYPALVSNPSASIIYRMTPSSLAHISRRSVRISGNAPLTAIFSALAATPIGYINGYGELQASLELLGLNGLNLQTIFGITENEIGTGASTAPFGVAILGQNIGTQGVQCVRATGTRVDGATVQFDFNDCKIEPQGEISLSREEETVLPCLLRFTSMTYRQFT